MFINFDTFAQRVTTATGTTFDQADEQIDLDMLFGAVTFYDSINGAEGHRYTPDMTDEKFARMVENFRF